MKILIATDMDGISGVINWDQVTPGTAEHTRFRQVMTDEVNAAIRGVYHAGASQVTVTDGHWLGTNILIEYLDSRARLNSGSGSPLTMVQGVEDGVDGAIFLGYHARAGSRNAVLDHTWSNSCVANLWLNGVLTGEYGLNAAVCGHFNVPVILITGDQTTCEQATELLGPLETAVIKRATGKTSAECLPHSIAQEKICEAAARAVLRLRSGDTPKPFRTAEPVTLEVEFYDSGMADRASMLPGTERVDGRRTSLCAPDMVQAYRGFIAAAGFAAT